MMRIDMNRLVSMLALSLSLGYGPSLAAEDAVPKITPPGEKGGLNLETAMAMAYRHSFSRQATEEDRKGSEARQSQIRGGYGPKLSVEGARGWIDTDVNKLAGKTLPTGQRYPDQISSVGVIATQPITQIFAADQNLAAERKVEASLKNQEQADSNDARLNGADAYIRTLKAIRFLAINEESQELILRQKKDANSLLKSGRLAQLDFSRFELAASEANSLVIEAKAQLAVATDSLREVLGLPEGQSIELSDLGAIPDSQVPTESPRSEILSAEERVGALESQLKAQTVSYWPQVNAFARYNRDFAAKDVNVNLFGLAINLPKEDFRDQFTYGFNLQWDIWDWGTRSGRHAEIGSLIARSRIQKEALASRLRIETSQAEAEWERASQTLKNAQVADTLSAEILRSYDIKFRNGLATTTDLLSVQRDRTRAQAQLANATYDLHGAALRRKRALGGAL